MGTYQRQFDTVFLEQKLVKEIMQLSDGEELAQYEDEEHQVEKLLEDENFLQQDEQPVDEYLANKKPVDGEPVDMVDQTMAEQNVPTLTDQKHVEYIQKKMFGAAVSTLLPIKRVL